MDLGKFKEFGKRYNKIIETVYENYYSSIVKRSNAILTYNKLGEEYFANSHLIHKNKIQILNNTIDEDAIFNATQYHNYAQEADKMFPRLTAKIKNFRNIVLYVGTINYDKNLQILPLIHEKLGESYFFIIVGDGIYKPLLEKQMNSANTFFAGEVVDIMTLCFFYKKSNVFLLPGLGGLAINQSLALVVPVICSEADGSEQEGCA